jgi:alanine racemase
MAGREVRMIDDAEGDMIAGARLTIDLGALVRNYRRLCAQAASARVAGVVKADGYGLGAVPVAQALAGAGCRDFFVAHLAEALPLLDRLPADATVVVLNGLQPGAESLCARIGAMPVLNSLDQARRWAAIGRFPCAVQVDSGMSRLGMAAEEVQALAADPALLAALDIRLVMSHLACGDEPGSPANAWQRSAFEELAALLPPAPRSLANSGGTFQGDVPGYDLCRTGIALYGGSPLAGRPNPMEPVVGLDARVIQTRIVAAGAGVGYGLTFTAEGPRRIATIGVGYADGWPRHLGNVGSAFVGDVRVPIAGRVSMDSITLDVTDAPPLTAGDRVELLGPHQTIDDVARDAGTISYEILTQLGHRYARRYIGNIAP